MIPRVYADTSVIGGCLDQEFRDHSERFLKDVDAGVFRAVLSNITIAELQQAPEEVRAILERRGLREAEVVYLDDEAVALAEAYIRDGAIGVAHRVDAQHIAIATIQRVDLLVSWNFQHIVRWSRIRAFNSVNLKLGYPELEIRSPREVGDEEEGV